MRVKVYYFGRRGSAKTVAGAIAEACGCGKEPLLPAYMPEGLDLMFLGCEGRSVDAVTREFIGSLNPDRARAAALFICGKQDGVALAQMRKELLNRGVRVLPQTLVVPLKGLFARGPQASDLERARQFCLDSVNQIAEKSP